jgi:hypothetical protein
MTKQEHPLISGLQTNLEGTEKICPWAYGTTNTIVRLLPSEYTLQKYRTRNPSHSGYSNRMTIRVPRKENRHHLHSSETFVCRAPYRDRMKLHKTEIYRFIFDTFLACVCKSYGECKTFAPFLDLAMSE